MVLCSAVYRIRHAAALSLLLACASMAVAVAAERPLRGLPLAAALQELRHNGLRLLYSSELVPAELTVVAEPSSASRIDRVREILAPHRLELRAIDTETYVVARAGVTDHGLLRVIVFDAVSRVTLMGARVTLHPIGRSMLTNESGEAIFESVPLIDCEIEVRATDYDGTLGATLAGCRSMEAIGMPLQPLSLAEIQISTSRYSFLSGEFRPSFSVGSADLQATPALAADPLRVVGTLPGIALDGLSARPIIRGSEPSDVLTLLDGFPLRQVFHVASYRSPFSLLSPDLLKGMHVYTGGFPLRYGNRSAGVLEFESIDAPDERSGGLGIGLVDVRGHWTQRSASGHSAWLFAARHGLLRDVLARANVEEGQPNFRDGLVSWRTNPNDRWSIRVQSLAAGDELEIQEEDREFARLEGRARYIWASAEYRPTDAAAVEIWLGHSRIGSHRTGSVISADLATGDLSDQRAVSVEDMRVVAQHELGTADRIEGGFEWSRSQGGFDYRSTVSRSPQIAALFGQPVSEARSFQANMRRQRTAAFAAWRRSWSSRDTAEIGLRAQHIAGDATSTQWTLDPRVSYQHAWNERLTLRLHWGRFHQALEMHELALEDGVSSFSRAERVDHWIAGLDWRATPGVTLRLEAYHKRETRPAVRFENLFNTYAIIPELAVDRYRLAPGGVRMQGLECSVRSEGRLWNGWFSAVAARARDHIDGLSQPRAWDQRWSVGGGLGWQRGRWQITGQVMLHDGWPTTSLEPAGDAYQLGEAYRRRLPMYATVDVRAEYRRPLRLGQLQIAFALNNATDRVNTCCTEIDAERDEDDSLTLDIGALRWLPLLPQFDVSWNF
jgi:hypothetical protein